MINKDLEQIEENDLQSLIDNPTLERKRLEYKQSLPTKKNMDKIEFLADVSSFANASGGDIVYGIVEDRKTGAPKELKRLDIENFDEESLRLQDMIRHGIEPRIMAEISPPIPLSKGGIAFVIRVTRGWIKPHRVIFQGHDKFYSRTSSGKYQLDVMDLRLAFTLSEVTLERIRRFREERIANISSDETPVILSNHTKTVLHLLPIVSFELGQNYEIWKVYGSNLLRPIKSVYGSRAVYNFDGLLVHSLLHGNGSNSYLQLYKNGVLEAADASLISPNDLQLGIDTISYEMKLIESVKNYLLLLKALRIETPILIFLTLLGIKGYRISIPTRAVRREPNPIDRDILMFTSLTVEKYDADVTKIMKPCFDSIWNACGFPRDLHYDKENNWRERMLAS